MPDSKRNRPVDAGAAGGAPGAAPTMPRVGDRLESFEILETLGAGGMGTVYLASDLRLDRLVALKILPPPQAADAETVARFEQEGRAAARLDHENIARVHTIGYDKGYHFIAFEYVEGTTLRQRIDRDGAFEEGAAIAVALQICGALEHASERGLVHRDIKPSNIVVTPRGQAKLVDMGLARGFERDRDDAGLTQSGVTLGTFDYISPEQARDPRDVDVRSDLYSLGCTLFHMLAGRPPFPEGTMLQKLLQHQEDPPPDLQGQNPRVSARLAAIVARLMEKDRNRRFQSPRELAAALAGSGGAPEAVPAAAGVAPAHPNWRQHLTWAAASIGACAVVGFLVLQNALVSAERNRPASSTDNRATPRATSPASSEPANEAAPQPAVAAEPPRELRIDSERDLTALLEAAPSGATVVLTDNGPYFVRPVSTRDFTPNRPSRSLTIRAAAGTRPVIAPAPEGGAGRESALLAFRGGRVHIEGVALQLGAGGQAALTGIFARDVDLSLTRCQFQRGAGTRGQSAILVQARRTGPDEADPGPSVRVASSAFPRGMIGVRASGPTDLELRDCTFGPDEPVVWFDNFSAARPVQAHLAMRHASVLAGGAPVIRLSNTSVKAIVEDSVIAAAGSTKATLLATDAPELVDWLGRENLYGGIATFLEPLREGRREARIASYSAWADAPGVIREMRSVATDAHVWAPVDPVALLDTADLARAYELDTFAPRVGARQGPRGAPPRFNMMLSELLETARGAIPSAKNSKAAIARIEPTSRTPSPGSIQESQNGRAALEAGSPSPERNATVAQNASLPMDIAPEVAGTRSATIPISSSPMPDVATAPMDQGSTGTTNTPMDFSNPASVANPAVALGTDAAPASDKSASRAGSGGPVRATVETADQFRRAVTALGDRGGTIILASDARIELDAIDLPRGGRWSIAAEPGLARPRLKFVAPRIPGPFSREPGRSIRLEPGGSLRLQDIDLVWYAGALPKKTPAALIALGAGSDLEITRCTLTVVGVPGDTAGAQTHAIRIASDFNAAVSDATASLRIDDSLIRTAGGVIDVAGGMRAEVSISNSIVIGTGMLLVAHGQPDLNRSDRLKLIVRQSTLRLAAGLVRVESTSNKAELPVTEVVARESILAIGPEAALTSFLGQGTLDTLRDRLLWEGKGVAYHRINTYRRDESALPGTTPISFRRLSWQVAVGPREDASFHDDVEFQRPWPADRAPWTAVPEDFRLAPTSPVPGAGAQIDRVPQPPRLDD